MHLFDLPPEILQAILNTCVVVNGLDLAAKMRMVCHTIDQGIISAICHTRALAGTTDLHYRHWRNKRLAAKYVFTSLCADRALAHPLTRVFQETVAFIIKEKGADRNDNNRLHYTRLLCRAVTQIGVGHLQLENMTGITKPPRRIHHRRCDQIDNYLAATSYLGMHPSALHLIANGAKQRLTCFGTPLTCAASTGNTQIVQILLTANSVSEKSWLNALAIAARNGHLEVICSLLDFKESKLKYSYYHCAISQAALGGHIHILQWLHAKRSLLSSEDNDYSHSFFSGTDRTPDNYWSETILVAACSKGRESIVRMVLESGTEPIIRFGFRKNDIFRSACIGGHEHVVRLLLSQPRIRENPMFKIHLDNALSWAAKAGWLRIAKLLVEHGANINPEWTQVHKPLAWVLAAEHGHIEMLHFFIEHGADLAKNPDITEKTVAMAKSKGYTTVVHILETNGGGLRTEDRTRNC